MRVERETFNCAMSCDGAMNLMSPFIDSAVSAEEASDLRFHLSGCAPCHRQMQSLVSMRNLLAGAEPMPVPEDLQLETRVRLSNARARRGADRWRARLDNILKPAAVPAVTGVTVTLLCFAILLGGLLSKRTVMMADEHPDGGPSLGVYEPPSTTTPTLKRFGADLSPDLDQALSVQTEVNDKGRVYDYTIIGGTRSADIDKWLQEQLLLAQFHPATNWGIPVPSRMILAFVNVRG